MTSAETRLAPGEQLFASSHRQPAGRCGAHWRAASTARSAVTRHQTASAPSSAAARSAASVTPAAAARASGFACGSVCRMS
mgnify:CR=1 FL=1